MIARAVSRARARLADERGLTLAELLVVTVVMGIVATIFTSVLASVQTSVGREQDRTAINDQARLAIEQMDREIRSGSLIYDPASESFASPTCGGYACQANYALRVLTQANATTRTPATQCVQWIIQNGQLMRRSWAQEPPTATSSLAGWRVVATGIVNQSLTPPVPAFSLDPSSAGRAVNITLMVNPRLGQPYAPTTVRINTSVAIRNTTSGDPCTPIPTT